MFLALICSGCSLLPDLPVDERLARYRETGAEAYGRGDYGEARSRWENGLELARLHGNAAAAADFLIELAHLAEGSGDYESALRRARECLRIAETLDEAGLRGRALDILGLVHRRKGEYAQAQAYSREVRTIAERLGDPRLASASARNLGAIHQAQGNYEAALALYQEALALARNGKDPSQEAMALNNMGGIYRFRGEYRKALAHYQRSLALRIKLKDLRGEGMVLGNICLVYQNLNDTERALDYCQRALAVARGIGDRAREANHVNNIGGIYRQRAEFRKALDWYERSAALKRALSDRSGEGRSLNNIGEIYLADGELDKALPYFSRTLKIREGLGERSGESATHYNLGLIYLQRREYEEALSHLDKALAIQFVLREPNLLWRIYHDLSRTHAARNNPGVAIFYGKLAVNTIQSVRGHIKDLDDGLQRSYLADKTDAYRHLAGLLLEQERVLEAQQVLDLLKVQEIQDYLKDLRGDESGSQSVQWSREEQRVQNNLDDLQNQAIHLGRKLADLRAINPADRNPEQEREIAALVKAQERLIEDFNQFIESPAVAEMLDRLSASVRRQSLDLEELNALRDNLQKLQQDAVLLYPLILEERLELVLVTPYSPPIRRTVSVKRQEIIQAIGAFRAVLGSPSAVEAKPLAQRFYDWLIKPIESDLAAASARTILYAPDGALRYIPLAAAHDGSRWLIERFRIHNITAASLADLDTRPHAELQVLAGAFTNGSYSFEVGQQILTFKGLSYAAKEVDALSKIIPRTTKLLDSAFSVEATVPKMDDHTVVHLATHAAFLVGRPEDSFILFGNGDRVNLNDAKRWSLKNVDLVVLSACETGLGGRLGNGEEILGFGYLMQRAGARAALASLWPVSDGGTQALMTAFYTALQGGVTKAEALRLAQLALATGDYETLQGQNRGAAIALDDWVRDTVPAGVYSRLNHPYYWAPFILIGNGL